MVFKSECSNTGVVAKKDLRQSMVPKSLSVLDMMKLGKLIKKDSKVEIILVEKFDVVKKMWTTVCDVIFEVEDVMAGEAGFFFVNGAVTHKRCTHT